MLLVKHTGLLVEMFLVRGVCGLVTEINAENYYPVHNAGVAWQAGEKQSTIFPARGGRSVRGTGIGTEKEEG